MNLADPIQKSQRLRLRPAERRLLLLVGDFSMAWLALVLALVLWAINSREWLGFTPEFFQARVQPWFYLLPFAWLLLLADLYDVPRASHPKPTVRGVASAAAIGLGSYLFVYFASPPNSLPRTAVAYFLIAVALFTLAWRLAYIRIFTHSTFLQRVLLVGAGKAGSTLLEVLARVEANPFEVIGVVDDDPQKLGQSIAGYPVLGGAEELPAIINREQVTDLIVAISGSMQGSLFQALLDAQQSGVEITTMQNVYEELLDRVPIFHLEADWMLRSFVEQSRVGAFYLTTKRLIDLSGGLIGTLLLAIILPGVTLANLIETGWPIFYLQTRSGKNDQPYRVIKFRTMRQDAEKDGVPQWTKENDDRVTRVGRLLRKTHLDELPQFLNVLRGDMSLVGPRPERPELIALFQQHVPFYRARLLVKPGLSGWAQIHQNYAANVEETNLKLEYDLFYIKHRSLWFDLGILLRTPATMLGFRGR